jgi:hypothetical protein
MQEVGMQEVGMQELWMQEFMAVCDASPHCALSGRTSVRPVWLPSADEWIRRMRLLEQKERAGTSIGVMIVILVFIRMIAAINLSAADG